ncbi:hypothetical protein [Undibacterium sp. Ji49W]|uniref:hypothetical protein n=1 Tax=Undibacterium sp. Ji49W TaxID=3413040 RepID=UPI003BF3DFF5
MALVVIGEPWGGKKVFVSHDKQFLQAVANLLQDVCSPGWARFEIGQGRQGIMSVIMRGFATVYRMRTM